MNSRRLFYMNITFMCNNSCRFCISHNTSSSLNLIINPLESIKYADAQYGFASSDTVVLSGGEPTLSPQFDEILDYLSTKVGQVVIYTNGTNSIFHYECNIRWIVSIYGGHHTHNYYTRNDKSFFQIKSNLYKASRSNIEVKVILNPLFSELDLKEILDIAEFVQLKSFSISCLCDAHNNFERRISFLRDKITLLESLFYAFPEVKLSNIPLCVNDSIVNYIENSKVQENEEFDKYIIILPTSNKEIDYDGQHRWTNACTKCGLRFYCRDTNLSYRVLRINDGKQVIGE